RPARVGAHHRPGRPFRGHRPGLAGLPVDADRAAGPLRHGDARRQPRPLHVRRDRRGGQRRRPAGRDGLTARAPGSPADPPPPARPPLGTEMTTLEQDGRTVGHTDNSIMIDADLDHVWRMTNDLAAWPDLFTEYSEV